MGRHGRLGQFANAPDCAGLQRERKETGMPPKKDGKAKKKKKAAKKR
jgi:hypothetical protein